MRTALNNGEVLGIASLCFQCGACTASCPLNVMDGVKMSPRRILRSIQLGLKPELDSFACMMCMACEGVCPRGVKVLDVIRYFRAEAYKENRSPEKLVQALWNIYEEGNPWGYPSRDRGRWATGLEIKERAKTLLYVGCITSYDARLQKIARNVVKLLIDAGVDFAILGDKEKCCGDTVYNTGETDFLEELIQNNIRQFRETGAETIITISPHCYNMLKNIYPRYGGNFEVLHYTEYLSNLLDANKLHIHTKHNGKITYHDPCYLSRYFNVFEEPRRLIEHVEGAELVEMKLSKAVSLCCGGGGGRILFESKPEERTSNIRVKQAAETGAKTLATSCPYCIINFEDSVKTQRLDIRVVDVTEILTGT
jgi:Fe-S oxidoreductase